MSDAPRAVYNVALLAVRWGVSTTFVYDLLNSGELRGFKLGNKLWRIKEDAVEEYECRAGEPLDNDPLAQATAIRPDHTAAYRLARDMRRKYF